MADRQGRPNRPNPPNRQQQGNQNQRHNEDEHPPRNINWDRVVARNEEQYTLTDFFRLFEEFHPGVRGDDLRNVIKEELFSWQFSRVEVLSNAKIFKYIKIFLEDQDVLLPNLYRGTNLNMIRIIAAIWSEDQFREEVEAALARHNAHRKGSLPTGMNTVTPREIQTPGRQPNNDNRNFDTRRQLNFGEQEPSISNVYAKVQSCYKTDNAKFGGSNEENFQLMLTQYEHICRINNVNAQQKAQFFHAMLKDEALHFYHSELSNIQDWQTIVHALLQRYNSAARMRSIEDEVHSLTIEQFMGDSDHAGTALQKLARRIETLVPQCPNGRTRDCDKRVALYKAVRSMDCADAPITAMANDNIS